MPVRSLGSSVMRWPGAAEVDAAIRAWADKLTAGDRNVVAVGYFGSYARGDWGPGSDVDVVILVRSSETPFVGRVAPGDATTLPVQADVLTYTLDEWAALQERGGRFARTLATEVRWVAGEQPRAVALTPEPPLPARRERGASA